MKVVVSHNKPDFDALASLALARLLHPGSVAVLLGSLDSQVAAFVHLYRDPLKLIEAAEIALERVSELIVVDTADSKRIAPFDQLLGQVPVTLYDHHPLPANPIPAGKGLHQPVGATATILTLLLKANGIVIPQELASLALLGIHEDTGNLSFSLTRPEDHEAAAHLLRAGASLSLVQEFSVEHYTPEHRELFAQLLQEAAEQTLGGR
ncbi:MAG: DHH family phosphoesterase, partial [Truepera sp.]|nr:DHH family phosphoesterase [Truepera sp.]